MRSSLLASREAETALWQAVTSFAFRQLGLKASLASSVKKTCVERKNETERSKSKRGEGQKNEGTEAAANATDTEE